MSNSTRDIDQLSERKELPEGWRWVKLGEVCLPDRQIVEPNTSHAESLTYYSLEHIESETGRILKTPTEPVELEGKSMTFQFDRRHVLYGKLRPYLNKVALPFSSGRCTTEMIPLLPSDDMDRIFLAWLLRRQETVEFAMQGKTGSRMPRADMDSLLMLQIPLPSLSEQQRIAAILKEQMAAVEKARTTAQERLKAIKALPAAFLRQIFPDPGQPLPDGWKWAKLGEIFDITSSKRVFESDWTRQGVPFYRAREIVKLSQQGFVENDLFISEEMFAEYSAKYGIPQTGDIMVTGVGTLGICHVVREVDKFYFKDGNIIWLKKKSENESSFIEYAFRSDLLRKQIDDSSGATVGTFTIIKAKNTRVPLPPMYDQQRIVAILKKQMSAVEKASIAAEAELKAINTLPAALLRRAFNGEL
jgi:type I restriction enzyme, S subunit